MKLHKSVTNPKTINYFSTLELNFREVHGEKYSYKKSIYLNAKTQLIIICKKHGEFNQTPMDHLRSSGCRKCSIEARNIEYNLKHSELFEICMKSKPFKQITKYVKDKDLIKFKCDICSNIWEASASNIRKKNGTGCPKCANIILKTNKQFVSDCKITFAKPLEKYAGGKRKILFKCKVCEYEWVDVPTNILYGKVRACPKCRGKVPIAKDEFLGAVTVNPNTIIINDYIGLGHTVKCKCRNCTHTWTTNKSHLREGKGCNACGGRMLKTHEQFEAELRKLNPNVILKSEYKNSKTNMNCECRTCGHEWLATPSNLRKLRDCPECAVGSFKPKEEAELYLYNIDDIYLGFGITGSPKQRHSVHKSSFNAVDIPFNHTHSFYFKIGLDAYNLEQKIRDKFIPMRIDVKGFKTETTSLNNLDAVLLLIEREMA